MSVSEAQYQDWADDLADLDQQIEDLQKAKGDFYKNVRDEHGKKTADSLKLAVKISRMDSEKRAEAEEVDAEAFRILAIISKPRAPRATRVAIDVPSFVAVSSNGDEYRYDAETGEITEPQSPQAAQMQAETAVTDAAVESHATSLPGAEGIADRETIQPETANDDTPVQDAKAMMAEVVATAEPEPEQEVQIFRPGPVYAAPGIVVMEHTPPVGIVAHPYIAAWPCPELVLADGEQIREPIVKQGAFIVDGRQRYFAARAKGIEYPVVQYGDGDLLADVIAFNLASRNLGEAQLRAVAAKLVKAAPERADDIMQMMGLEQARAAQ